jgi:hypothetical protein
MNEFEQKLSRQPLRQIPAEWRAGILSAAESVVGMAKQSEDSPTVNPISWWRELFWPHPKAWAGLTTIWVFIFVVDFSMRDKSPVIAEKISPPSPEVVAELRQQKLLFAELIGSTETLVADRQKLFLPRPRSERTKILTV